MGSSHRVWIAASSTANGIGSSTNDATDPFRSSTARPARAATPSRCATSADCSADPLTMPRATNRYAFEVEVLGWAIEFRGGEGFLALFDAGGVIARVVEADRTSFGGKRLVPRDVKDRAIAQHASWIFYD